MKIKYIIVIALLFILFFIEFPKIIESRSLDRISDFAHIIIFAAMVNVILKNFSALQKFPKGKQFVYIIVFIILLSIAIESLQFFSRRTPDIGDILRNLLGGFTGFLFVFRKEIGNRFFVKIIVLILIFFVLFQAYFVIRSVADDTRAQLDFPILSDFESSFEIDRWEGRAEFKITDSISRNGNHSLEVLFKKDEFSDISLIQFPGNWSAYNNLTFSVFDVNKDSVTIYVRIYDIDYNQTEIDEKLDRYDHSFRIFPGWNLIKIPVHDILTAPRKRTMNLTHLTRIRIFTQFLNADRLLYIDTIRLN
jgi:VanZ family protein